MQKEKTKLGQYRKNKLIFGLSPIGFLTLVACGGGSKETAKIETSVSGHVIKGPLSGALVFLDYDGDAVQDSGEPSVRTDSKGSYTISNDRADYDVVALTDLQTLDTTSGTILPGLTLKAPKQAKVVTPITTLIQEGNFTNAQIAEVLQIPVEIDPLSFHPYNHYHNISGVNVEKVGMQIITVVEAFAAAAEGAGASEAEAFKAALDSVTDVVKAKVSKIGTDTAFVADQRLDLTKADDLELISNQFSAKTAIISSVDNIALKAIRADTITAIKNVNDKIESVIDLTSTGSKSIFSLAQVLTDQVLAATKAETEITGTGDIAFTLKSALEAASLNQPPTDIILSSSSVDAVSRTLVVGTLTTTDADQNPGVDFKYELADVPGSDHAKFFGINQATAEVSLISQTDYATQPIYNITILSTDDGGKTFSKTFVIEGYNTRTLTAGLDTGTNFITTGGNDTFFANTSGHLSTGDILDAGTGTDNLVAVQSTGSTNTIINPTLSGFETVRLSLTDTHATATTTTLNLDKSPGVSSVIFGNNSFNTAAETVVLSGVTTATTMTITDPAGAATTRANNYTINYSNVTAVDDSADVNVKMTASDGELGTITIAGVEKVTVNASGGYDASYQLATPNAKIITINNEADSTASDSNAGTVKITSVLAETLNVNSLGDIVINDNTNQLSKLTSVNINSQIADKTVDLTSLTTTATSLKTDGVTINVRGAGDANIGVDTNFGTYNATSNPDKVTVNATGSGNITVLYNNYSANTIITGSGNDTVTISSGNVLNNVDSIDLGGGDDAIVATAVYSGNNAIDLFHDDDVTTTDPVVKNTEIASVTLDDPGGAASVSAASASFAATLNLIGDIEDTVHTINNIGATNEIASVKFSNLTDGKTTILAGLTMTAGSGGATAEQVAAAFVGGVADSSDAGGASGAVMSGTLSGYNVTTGGSTDTVEFTATSTGNKTDLSDTGTGADPVITITQGAMQIVKIGKTLDLTDSASALVLVQKDATSSDPAQSLAITSDLLDTSTVGNIDDLRANVVTAVTLDLASTDTDVVTATVDQASFDKATSVKVTSAENVNFGAIDAANGATLDFTGVTGTLSVTVDTANDYTVKGASGTASTFIMGTGLDKDDIIIGGSSTTDSLTATINGLTSTTGDLLLTGVESLNLTVSGASTLDLADVTGATSLTVDGSNNLIMSTVLPNEIVTVKTSSATGNMTYGVGTGTVAVTGGSGIDIVTGNSGVNNISTAGGDDIIKFAGTHLTYEDTVNGGANANSLSYTSDEIIDLADFTNVTNVQTLTTENTVHMTGNLGALAANAGIRTVTFNDDGDGDNLVIDAEFNAALSVNLDDGDNALNASAYTGTLTVAITEAIANAPNDTNTIVGGVGTSDVISITADGTGISKANMATFTKFEQLNIANDVTTGTIVLDDANAESGKTFTVNSSAITTASKIFNLDASAETDGFLIVNGSAGIDKITMSQSSNGDTLSLGGAADIIYVATANLTSADTVNGGAGTDILSLTDASTVIDLDFTNVTNLENITQATASHDMTLTLGSLAAAAGMVKVVGGTGSNTVTIDSGYTGALTVELAAGTDTVDGSAQTSGSLNVTAAQDSLTAADTLTGGSATDTLTITADGSAALVKGDLIGLTKFETISIANNAAINISTHNNNVAASETLAVNASALTSALLTFDASEETDGAYNVTTAGSGDHVITLGAGDDTVTANTGANNLTLGAGNDTVIIASASLTSTDTFNFGTGTDDVLKMSDASTVIDADFTNITNLDRITQNTASHGMNLTLGTAATAAGLTKVTGGTGTNSVVIGSSYTGSLTVDLAAGTDTVNGSAQTSGSLIVTAAVASITSADTITGGSATDTLTITTDGSTSLTSANLANVTSFGTIQSAGNNAFNVTMHDNNSVSSNIVFNASSLTTGALTFNSAAEDDGSYTLTAGGGDDSITFGTGADVIKFANGKLTIADTVNGGGTGINTIKFTNSSVLADADFTNVTNFQNLTLDNLSHNLTLVMDAEVDQAGINSVTTGTGTNSVTIGSNFNNNLTVALGAGTDTVDGANQSGGSLTVTAAQDSISGDTLTGGSAATNTLTITGGGTALDANDMANITAFNTIQTSTNAALGVTMNNANVASGANLAFDASSLTSAAFTFNAAAETDGTYTITVGGGDDNITLGAGADIILFATDNLTSSDTINGGGGTDILKLTNASTVVDSDFTNITNLETITQNTASHGMNLTLGSLAAAAGLVTVTGGTGTNSVTIGSGYNGNLTVALAAGTDTIDGSGQTSGSLTVTAAQDSITTADTITGGSATDTLTITGGGTALVAADLDKVTNFGTIKTATDAAFSFTTHENNAANGVNVVFDASSMTSANLIFSAAAETDGGMYTVTAGGGGDNITLGSGADTVKFAAAKLTNADTVNGGGGSDTIKFTASSSIADADLTNVTNIENLTLDNLSHNLTLVMGSEALGAGLTSVTTGTGTNSITIGSGYTGALNITLGAGTDTVNGSGQSSGSLTVTIDQDSITTADTITGGSATDTLTITSSASAGALASADLDNLTSFSTIQTAGNNAFGLTTHDNNVASGQTVTFNANSLTSAVLTFDASAETNGKYIITATGSGAHVITASSGADTITAGDGANTIIAGDGADTITTAGGADIIKWVGVNAAQLAAQAGTSEDTDQDFSAGSAGDKIADFTSGTDKLHFAAAALTNEAGDEADALKTIAAGGVVANTDRFVEVTGALANGEMGTAITALNGLDTSAVAIGDSFLAFLNDSTHGYLYMVQQASSANTISAADTTLIAQLTNVTNVADGDFVTF